MKTPPIVSPEEWYAARERLLITLGTRPPGQDRANGRLPLGDFPRRPARRKW